MKRYLKNFFTFYIYSNLHVALAGLAMVMVTNIKFGILTEVPALFVFLSIILSYNFIRFYEIKNDRLEWFSSWFYQHKIKLLALSFVSFLGIITILFYGLLHSKALWILTPFVVMTFFYAIPLGKINQKELSFRNFPFIKIFSIAIAWAGTTVLFPVLDADLPLTSDIWIEFIQRIALLIAITIPFDIRDITSDTNDLRTIPQIVGILKSKYIGTILLLIFIGLELVKTTNIHYLSTIIIAGITALFLWLSSDKKSRFYTSFWVESIPIFWWILLFILKK